MNALVSVLFSPSKATSRVFQVLGQYDVNNAADHDPDNYFALRRDRLDDLAFDINVSTS